MLKKIRTDNPKYKLFILKILRARSKLGCGKSLS